MSRHGTRPLSRLAVLSLILFASGLPAAAQDVGVTGDSIKIGIFGAFTGSVPLFGYPMTRGGTLLFEEVNAAGGIHGRKLVMVEEDDQCDPSKGVAAVKKLIHEHKVFMLHGGNCSNVSLAVRPEIERAKVPWLASSTNAKIYLPTNRYVFTTIVTADVEGALMADFAQSVPNAKRVAIIGHQDAWGLGKSEPALKRLEELKLNVVANENMDRGANDSTPQTLRLKQANPDVVLVVLYPKEGAIFLRDAVKYGLRPVFVGNTAIEDIADLVAKAGTENAARNVYSVTLLRNTMDNPRMTAVADRLKARYPGVAVSPLLAWTYSGAEVIVEALRRAGPNLTRERFVDELERLQGMESAVFVGTLGFSREEHRGNRGANFAVYKDGKFQIIGPKYTPMW